jgi:gluconate 2-dehydrogenase gamma chain
MPEPQPLPGTAYFFLTRPEVRFLDAAVEHLIPTDELGPGARDAGVSCFIDRQLASAWGTYSRNYRMGPWGDGTSQQGNQSRLTPQEIYRAGIRETNIHCVRVHDKAFDFISVEQQEAILRALEMGEIELESLTSKRFFNLMLKNTMEGFFADPMYGGNRNKVGWRLVGFPGVAASTYPQMLEKFNVPYRVEPVSILDIEQGLVSLDDQGSPKHVPVKVERRGNGSH